MCVDLEDDNECDSNKGGCEHKCSNQPGSFTCHCYNGYHLLDDMFSCSGMSQQYIIK